MFRSKSARKNTTTGSNEPAAAAPKATRKGRVQSPKPKTVSTENKPIRKASQKIKDPASEINHSATGIPPSEITKSEIEHPASEIPMEVHHHPQLGHNPKPFKEYLLEGFMIFIAVMMGFIAENIREAIDNNEQVKHLTAQLVQDLKTDTAQLNHNIAEETQILRYNDTLINLAQQPLATANTRRIQKMAANSHSMWIFHPSLGAIAAIKNQVHLKQFSNSEIIRFFAQYEKHIDLLNTDREINLQYQRVYLDPFLTQHLTPPNMIAAFDTAGRPTAKMRDLKQADLDQLAADMVLTSVITREMVNSTKMVKADAVALLQYVKKQYQPEE
jgi:hypothetical protein